MTLPYLEAPPPSLMSRAVDAIRNFFSFKRSRNVSWKTMAFMQGLDVSCYQPTVHWPKVKRDGSCRFVYVRAMAGTWQDPLCAQHVAGAMAADIDTGVYIYWKPDMDQEKAAEKFANIVRYLGCTLPPAVDVEDLGGLSPSDVLVALARFLKRLESFGYSPIIYTFPYFIPVWPSGFKGYKLWIAHYGVDVPKIPSPWKDWLFWQYIGDKGNVPGVLGPCDQNACSLDSLDSIRQDMDK